ncbi:MAG: hypothetical protein ABI361_14220 [Nitrososphaera sp.]
MAFGEKLFEETGKVTNMSVESVHPVEGTKMKVNFVSEIRGFGNFPSGRNIGSGTINQYPHGVWDASYQGVIITQGGDHYMWWAHEKSRTSEDGSKVRGLVTITGYTQSQKLASLNKLIIVAEVEFNPAALEFSAIGYEWK